MNKKIKVLMFGWELPPNISGGLGVACAGLLSGLKNTGQVGVNFTMPQLLGVHLTAAQLDRLAGPLADYLAPPAPGAARAPGAAPAASYTANAAEALSFALSAEQVLAERGPFDLIHCHDWLTFLAGVAAKRLSGLPLVLHLHSIERDRGGFTPNRVIADIERYGLLHADAVIAVSDHGRRRLIESYQVPPDKVRTIYNATRQLPAAGPARGVQPVPVVSFIGRITSQKGPLHFVEAARRVAAAGLCCRFVIAGVGDLLPVCQALAAAHGIGDVIEFPGFLDGDAVATLLARSEVFVMPSESEPFGIAALEAIHAGVPVVISEHSGVTEVVQSVVKVANGDVAAIAAAIIRLLTDRAFAKDLAAKALSEARLLNWDAAGRQALALYREVLQAAPSP